MLKSLILLVLLSSASAFANFKWSDLIEGKDYTVDRDIELAKNLEVFKIAKGDSFKLVEFKELPMINVYLGQFKVDSCKDNEQTSEMILVDIKDNSKTTTVGANLSQECILEVYLEKRDLYSKSLFF